MSHVNTVLPKEVAALVQHIELNRSGWWERTTQRLVLAAIWLSDRAQSIEEISSTLKEDFRLPLSAAKLSSALRALEGQDLVVALPGDLYRIPDTKRQLLDRDIKVAEEVANAARDFFLSLVRDLDPGLKPAELWVAFESDFLAPLIKDVGANAYRLIAGDRIEADRTLADRFLKRFDPNLRTRMAEVITTFLDPKKDEVRAHVTRMLHARFCVEAGGLPESVIRKLSESVGKQLRFRVFLDTNFLFSLLELHENPSNEAARELKELIDKLKPNLLVQLFVIPRTIDEAKTSIASAKLRLSGIPAGRNYTQAALRSGVSGMAERFFTERMRHGGKLTAESWFDPYLNDFLAMARGKGVELFNENVDSYSTRQDVVDDILFVQEYEKRLEESKRKSYQKIAHDMILWHFAKDKRPAYIESPLDAQDWILTVDFRLIGFDQGKQSQAGLKVPLCLHPASFIQLLQFWVPRTREFEEAMLGSLRLPFLFQEFDTEAERTSLKILKGLGRFAQDEEMSEQTITRVVLNDGLRARLKSEQTEEEEIKLIRDALVEEMKTRAEAADNRANELQLTVKQKEAALDALDARKQAEIQAKDEELARLKAKVAEEKSRATAADQARSQKEAEVTELTAKLAEQQAQAEERQKMRGALLGYLGCLTLIIVLSGLAAWKADGVFSQWTKVLGPTLIRGLAAGVVFVLGHLLLELLASKRSQRMTQLWPFRQVRRFRRALWAIAFLGFMLGVLGNLIANRIQKNLDRQPPANSSTQSPAADPGGNR